MFSITGLLKALLFFVNALAILDEARFLRKHGLSMEQDALFQSNRSSLYFLAPIIDTCRKLRVLLVPLNLFVAFWMFIFG